MDRRNFLAGAAAPLFVPASAFGANDRITYGVIATGGRGRYIQEQFQKLGAQCVALCDVYEPNLEAAKKQSPDAKTFLDYNDLLARKNGRRRDRITGSSPCADAVCRARAQERMSISRSPCRSPSKRASRSSTLSASRSRSCRSACSAAARSPLMKAKKLVDDGILGQITLVKPQWHWNIAKELDNSPYRANSIGIAFSAARRSGRWSRCASGAGAISGTMPAAT